jgi:hypothetical protein
MQKWDCFHCDGDNARAHVHTAVRQVSLPSCCIAQLLHCPAAALPSCCIAQLLHCPGGQLLPYQPASLPAALPSASHPPTHRQRMPQHTHAHTETRVVVGKVAGAIHRVYAPATAAAHGSSSTRQRHEQACPRTSACEKCPALLDTQSPQQVQLPRLTPHLFAVSATPAGTELWHEAANHGAPGGNKQATVA